MSSPSSSPIGVFDSGLGGLSVLRHVRTLLPSEHLLYFADSGFAPYGARAEAEIVTRSMAIGEFLLDQGAKALVVACNTATAAAIGSLRSRYPDLPIVGVEPGLKPGAALSKRGIVGVLATERTVESERFARLQAQVAAETRVHFLARGCPGLADQVEKGELHSPATARLVRSYVAPLLEQGADTLVLGCTHYPFLRPLIEQVCASIQTAPVTIVDTGEPVARQLLRLLDARGLKRAEGSGSVTGFTTGSASGLSDALSRLAGIAASVHAIAAA